MKTIIIDDEHHSRQVVHGLLTEYFPNDVDIVAICENGHQGIEAIQKYKPDLIFLDVEMPDMKGFDMLKLLGFPNVSFSIIFSTAHSHYAVQAFRFSALDFLLKPVVTNEMIEAVLRAKERIQNNQQNIQIEKYKALLDNLQKDTNTNPYIYENRKIVLPTSDGTIFLESDEVIRLQSDGNYTTFHCKSGKQIMVAKQIGTFDEKKPFYRVHASHSVNPKHVQRITKGTGVQIQMNDGSYVDIGRRKKEDVLTFLKTFFAEKP
jgi:two-component system, LytTR family, response regulator